MIWKIYLWMVRNNMGMPIGIVLGLLAWGILLLAGVAGAQNQGTLHSPTWTTTMDGAATLADFQPSSVVFPGAEGLQIKFNSFGSPKVLIEVIDHGVRTLSVYPDGSVVSRADLSEVSKMFWRAMAEARWSSCTGEQKDSEPVVRNEYMKDWY